MQGRSDFPLTERGREQTRRLAAFFGAQGLTFDRHYASPLARAAETAELLASTVRGPAPVTEPGLAELSAGALEGLTFAEIALRFPSFARRRVDELGDYSEYGGESYADVQVRVASVRRQLEARHRNSGERVLLVGHGGFNYQLLKYLVCEPVPRVCIVKMGNCSITKVRLRERRGTFIGEVVFHVPLELMGGSAREDTPL